MPGSRNILTAKNGVWARETEVVADMNSDDNSSDRDARLVGPWAASLTPIKHDEIDTTKLLTHIKWLLDSGRNGVVLFGS